jgi:hypothetical protein
VDRSRSLRTEMCLAAGRLLAAGAGLVSRNIGRQLKQFDYKIETIE